MLSFERSTTKAKIEQEKQFKKQRAEISDAEKRAAKAVALLVKKQQNLEKNLAALGVSELKLPSSNIKRAFCPKSNAQATAKQPVLKKKPVKKVSSSSPAKKISIHIPRVSATTTASHASPPSNRCEIIYTDLNSFEEQPQPQPKKQITLSPPRNLTPYETKYTETLIEEAVHDQIDRNEMLTFMRNLEEEETVTTLFLNSSSHGDNGDGGGDDEEGLPEDWRILSVEFGKRLKDKIGEMVKLYNEFFEKMENVQD
ncbi:UNVERIFIED_CONTAM: hypothetical protein HDU68_003869 [Siphonaria sp. JEL0065]|nr:hypothetical protein HDU68_003869 [Siphonaria sp. JEL0065]